MSLALKQKQIFHKKDLKKKKKKTERQTKIMLEKTAK